MNLNSIKRLCMNKGLIKLFITNNVNQRLCTNKGLIRLFVTNNVKTDINQRLSMNKDCWTLYYMHEKRLLGTTLYV